MSMIKTTLAEQAYQELRRRIVRGQLAGGARLLPNELAEHLGISPTPVKEACVRLEADGLVVVSARRGMIVRHFEESDVEELYAARMLIEKGAIEAAFAAGRMGIELIAGLADCLEHHRRFAAGTTLDDLAEALGHDRQFHSMIVAAAQIPMISDTHARILGQTHTVFVSLPGDYSRSVSEHRDILDAIRSGSESQTIDAMRTHLERSRSNTLRQVQMLRAD